MDPKNWARIYFTNQPYKAEIVKSVLEDDGIRAILIDKIDHAHGGAFGEVEVYVQRDNVIPAKHIIDKKEL